MFYQHLLSQWKSSLPPVGLGKGLYFPCKAHYGLGFDHPVGCFSPWLVSQQLQLLETVELIAPCINGQGALVDRCSALECCHLFPLPAQLPLA